MLKMVTHHMGSTPCPLCGKANNAATGMTGVTPPKPGDYSVCIGCASPLRYTEVNLTAARTGEPLVSAR